MTKSRKQRIFNVLFSNINLQKKVRYILNLYKENITVKKYLKILPTLQKNLEYFLYRKDFLNLKFQREKKVFVFVLKEGRIFSIIKIHRSLYVDKEEFCHLF